MLRCTVQGRGFEAKKREKKIMIYMVKKANSKE
jgi:hypothetical protein